VEIRAYANILKLFSLELSDKKEKNEDEKICGESNTCAEIFSVKVFYHLVVCHCLQILGAFRLHAMHCILI
jgi:hypothetical protein